MMSNFKKFKNLWGKTTLRALSFGLIIAIVFSSFTSGAVTLFLGIFAAYMFIGEAITEDSENPVFIYKFCDKNWKFSIAMIAISVIGFIFFSAITVITWPLLIGGILLFIASIMGAFGAGIIDYSDDPIY